MNEGNYDQEQSIEDIEYYKLIRDTLKSDTLFVEPFNYKDLMRDFNNRNPTYGVTVEFKFLRTIQQCDFLESSQLQFFINLFRKAYPEVKLAAATCHFFVDFIVSLQKPTEYSQQNQTQSRLQSQIQESQIRQQKKEDSPKYKVRDDLINSTLLSKNDKSDSSNITNVTNTSNQNNKNDSYLSNQQTQQQNIKSQIIDSKYPQSQIQQSKDKNQQEIKNRQAQSTILSNPKVTDQNISTQSQQTQQQQQQAQSMIVLNQKVTDQNISTQSQQTQQQQQQAQSMIVSNPKVTDQNISKQSQQKDQSHQQVLDNQSSQSQQQQLLESTIHNETKTSQTSINNQSNKNITQQYSDSKSINQQSNLVLSNEKQQKDIQTATGNQSTTTVNLATQIQNQSNQMDIESQSQGQTQNQQKKDEVQVENNKGQSNIKQQSSVQQNQQQQPPEQIEFEQKQVQPPPPEKKFHFQITNITVQKPTTQEKIKKSQLPELIKQLAEINNLTEEQLKQQDYWYFPINQFQSHWISVVINLKKKEIYYFDSYYKKVESVIIQGINSILEHFNFNPQNFTIKPIYNQQINGYDCGVFILLSLLYTLQGKEYNYNQTIATKFRRNFLYILAVIGSQQNIDKDHLELITA